MVGDVLSGTSLIFNKIGVQAAQISPFSTSHEKHSSLLPKIGRCSTASQILFNLSISYFSLMASISFDEKRS